MQLGLLVSWPMRYCFIINLETVCPKIEKIVAEDLMVLFNEVQKLTFFIKIEGIFYSGTLLLSLLVIDLCSIKKIILMVNYLR